MLSKEGAWGGYTELEVLAGTMEQAQPRDQALSRLVFCWTQSPRNFQEGMDRRIWASSCPGDRAPAFCTQGLGGFA